MSTRAEGSRHAAAAGLAIGLAAPAALVLPLLPLGGLAPLVVAGLVAVVLGVAGAQLEWRAPAAVEPLWDTMGSTWADALALAVIGAAAAPWVHGAGWLGAGALVAGWLAAWRLSRVSVHWQVVPGVVALVGALIVGGSSLASDPAPYTLLEPTWSTWPMWGGPAVVAGLWAGGVGHGQWTRGPARRPGQVRAPWVAAGGAVLWLTALAVHRAARFEASPDPGFDGVSGVLVGLVLVSAGAVVLARVADARRHAALGGLAAAWFAGPALSVLGFGWRGALPLLMAASVALVARRLPARQRPLTTVIGALLVAAAVLGWPGLPTGLSDAVVLGVTLTAGFWLVATRTALAALPPETA